MKKSWKASGWQGKEESSLLTVFSFKGARISEGSMAVRVLMYWLQQ
jgi:hypothetical protein